MSINTIPHKSKIMSPLQPVQPCISGGETRAETALLVTHEQAQIVSQLARNIQIGPPYLPAGCGKTFAMAQVLRAHARSRVDS